MAWLEPASTTKCIAKEDFKYDGFEIKAGTVLKLNEDQIKFMEQSNIIDKVKTKDSFYDPVDT